MTGRAEAADQVTGNITVRARVMNLFESGKVEGVRVELRGDWVGENSGGNEVGREGGGESGGLMVYRRPEVHATSGTGVGPSRKSTVNSA
jgi:hypothetical protein